MLITSVLKSCHSFSLSAFITRCDASSLSSSLFKTIPTFIADDTVSPLTFCKVNTARSYSSISLRRSPVMSNIISSSRIPADLPLSCGSHLATSECHALRPSPAPLVTTLSSAGPVVRCSWRWWRPKDASSVVSSTCRIVRECNWVCSFSVRKSHCQRRVDHVASEDDAPVSPLGIVPVERGSAQGSSVDSHSFLFLLVLTPVHQPSSRLPRSLSSFRVVSKCTIRAASAPICSSVTCKLATNSSAANDDVYDSGRVF